MKTRMLAVISSIALLTILSGGALLAQSSAPGEKSITVRALDLSPQLWSRFQQGEIEELLVEFRSGDRIPVLLRAEGDLLESIESSGPSVRVKRAFWLKLEQDDVSISLDGTEYKPMKDVLGGSLTAGASSESTGGAVNGISVLFKAFLK